MRWLRPLSLLSLFAFPAVVFARLVADTPGLVLLAAALPAAFWVTLAAFVYRDRRRRWLMLGTTLMSGAVLASFAASSLNAVALAWITELVGDQDARWLVPAWIAPVIEEAAKAAVLIGVFVAFPHGFAGVADGIVHGALAGTGLAFTENLEYFTLAAVQGGHGGLVQSVYVRAVLGGLAHAAFAATVGIGLGIFRERPGGIGRVAAGAGLLLAMAEHVFWNIFAGPGISDALCNAPTASAACRATPTTFDLLVRAPAIAAVGLTPAMLIPMLLVFARRRYGMRRPMSNQR